MKASATRKRYSILCTRYSVCLLRTGSVLFFGMACLFFAVCLAGVPGWARDSGRSPDGPYVFFRKHRIDVFSVKANSLSVKRYSGPGCRVVLPDGKRVAVSGGHFSPEAWSYTGVPRICAVSDIHGNYPVFTNLLVTAGVIGPGASWKWGKGHLVIVGDVLDRGPRVTESLWLVYRLSLEARLEGGRVHYLLGNHETMVLGGDCRYAHPKYGRTARLMKRSVSGLYGPDTLFGRWIRSRNAVVKINRLLFVHAGFHPHLLRRRYSIDLINRGIRQGLGYAADRRTASRAASFLTGFDGPLWYRGYWYGEMSMRIIRETLLRFQADRVVTGHTAHNTIVTRFGGRVIGVDAGMGYGKPGEALIIEKTGFYRVRGAGPGRVRIF